MDCKNTGGRGRPDRQRQLLQELYAGPRGELTSMLQYLYQSCVLAPVDPELARAMDAMAKVEAHHLEILGALIALRDGTPSYGTPAGWWSGQSVYYGRAPCRMLLEDLRRKVESTSACLRAAGQMEDPETARILRRMAGDEAAQGELLRTLIARRQCRREDRN